MFWSLCHGFDVYQDLSSVSHRVIVRQKTFFSSLTEDKHICRNVLYSHYSEYTVTRVTISQFEDSFLDEAGYVLKLCLLSLELLDYKDCASDCCKLLLQKLFSSKKNYRKYVVNCCFVKKQQVLKEIQNSVTMFCLRNILNQKKGVKTFGSSEMTP